MWWGVLLGLSMVCGGCTGLQFGEHVSKYGRPLSDPVSPPASITIEPSRITNPIHTQQTLTATVRDAQGNPVYSTMVEWILARAPGAVGDIVEVKQDPLNRALKMTNTFALSGADRSGQAGITVTSVHEGMTHVIAVVPDMADKEHHKAFATLKWLDAQWEFPPDDAYRIGTSRTLTTTVHRASTGAPLVGFPVKWAVTGGPGAYFTETDESEAVTVTDENGVAQVTLKQRTPEPGQNQVLVTIIKPEEPGRACCPAASGVIAEGTTRTDWVTPTITLDQDCPSPLVIDETGSFHITVLNTSTIEARDVDVTTTLPAGLSYVSSDPPADIEGSRLSWKLGNLPAQARRPIHLEVLASSTGTLTTETSVTTRDGAQANAVCTTLVGEPRLSITPSCPESGIVGDPIAIPLTIQNTGTGEAKQMKLTTTLPTGLRHASGQQELTYTLGNLPAGQSLEETIELIAEETGSFTPSFRVSSDPKLTEEARCEFSVLEPKITLTKRGPENRFLGTTISYDLEVANTGSSPATGVEVSDLLPPGVEYLQSTPAGRFDPSTGKLSWVLGSIAPGNRTTLNVQGRASAPGRHCNTATVHTDRGLRESSEVCTLIEGLAALLLEVTDSPDPVEVGQNTTYTIMIKNQGTGAATQVAISATIPEGMEYVSSTGSTGRLVVLGRQVNFDPIPSLAPQKTVTYTIKVRGTLPGDLRFRVSMTADQLTTPVLEEESTKLYQ